MLCTMSNKVLVDRFKLFSSVQLFVFVFSDTVVNPRIGVSFLIETTMWKFFPCISCSLYFREDYRATSWILFTNMALCYTKLVL